jgi:hemerythrin-like domain-containing protein
MAERLALPRRTLVTAAAIAPLAACRLPGPPQKSDPKEVGSVEDLMREHGVLRRVLRIYDQLSEKLRAGDAGFDAAALADAASLFRDFGEDYHERMLEEAFLFPTVRKAGGAVAALADVLHDQHEHGRDLTDYVLSACRGGRISDPAALGQALRAMAVMYENHAAREDTILFPVWKAALSAEDLAAAGERFEDIEKRMFGGDGFDDAVRKIGRIEQRLGFGDLAQFTASAPASAAPPSSSAPS